MDWSLFVTLISVAGTICAIIFSAVSFNASRKKNENEAGERVGAFMNELGYIKSGIDDIKRKQEKADERYIELSVRITAVEESTKSAHKRIDTIMQNE